MEDHGRDISYRDSMRPSIVEPLPMAAKDGVPVDQRTASGFIITALCKEDKEQLNRIEDMLKKLQPREWVGGPK